MPNPDKHTIPYSRHRNTRTNQTHYPILKTMELELISTLSHPQNKGTRTNKHTIPSSRHGNQNQNYRQTHYPNLKTQELELDKNNVPSSRHRNQNQTNTLFYTQDTGTRPKQTHCSILKTWELELQQNQINTLSQSQDTGNRARQTHCPIIYLF